MFFSRPAGHKYIDRGDPQAFDKSVGDFVKDGAYHDWDLSDIVGKRRSLVILRLFGRTTAGGREGVFRTKGDTGIINVSTVFTQIADRNINWNIWVYTDKDGIIQYNFPDTWDSLLSVGVRGWFV